MKQRHGSDIMIYVGYNMEGRKSIKYDEPETGVYRIMFVSEEELRRIKNTASDKVNELLDHYIK